MTLSHSEFVGNQSIIDDNISLFGTNSNSSVTLSGLTSIISTTINFSGLSSGNVMVSLFFIPFISDQGGGDVDRNTVVVKILRGTTEIFNESLKIDHRNRSSDSGAGTVPPTGAPYVNIVDVDTNVSAGSYTYSAQVSGLVKVEDVTIAASVFTK